MFIPCSWLAVISLVTLERDQTFSSFNDDMSCSGGIDSDSDVVYCILLPFWASVSRLCESGQALGKKSLDAGLTLTHHPAKLHKTPKFQNRMVQSILPFF